MLFILCKIFLRCNFFLLPVRVQERAAFTAMRIFVFRLNMCAPEVGVRIYVKCFAFWLEVRPEGIPYRNQNLIPSRMSVRVAMRRCPIFRRIGELLSRCAEWKLARGVSFFCSLHIVVVVTRFYSQH